MFIDSTTILESARDCIDEPDPEDHSKHRCVISVGHLRWKERVRTFDLRYWDFASAARVFKAGYLKHECSDLFDDYHRGKRVDFECFHTRSLDLLDWLQKRAWSEVWSNVFRIVGKRLPAELVEHIIKDTFQEEGIDAQPGVDEIYGPQPTEGHNKPHHHHRSRVARLKREYKNRCDRVMDSAPESRRPGWLYDDYVANLLAGRMVSDEE